MAKRDFVVGMDVGTSKVVVVIGVPNETGLDIYGVGRAKSKGLRRGMVINIESTTAAIKNAVSEAELASGYDVTEVCCNVSGTHIRSVNSRGQVAIRNREVKQSDVRRVIQAARTIQLPAGSEVIHILPQEFVVDDNDGIKEPIGMAGVRLEAKVHIVTAAEFAIENLFTCCSREGVKVDRVVLSALAASEAVLRQDEKELGVMLLDIGAGTTDLIVWYNEAVIHTAVIPIGGAMITNDIALGLRTPKNIAEEIKLHYGCASPSFVKEEEVIEVPGVAGRKAQKRSRRLLAEIIETRLEEIFMVAHQEIQRAGCVEYIGSGVVLTGGTAKLPGIQEFAEHLFELPVRIGTVDSNRLTGLQNSLEGPEYSTAVGLALLAANDNYDFEVQMKSKRRRKRFSSIFGVLGDWFRRSYVEP